MEVVHENQELSEVEKAKKILAEEQAKKDAEFHDKFMSLCKEYGKKIHIEQPKVYFVNG